jgi:hypothetical protein
MVIDERFQCTQCGVTRELISTEVVSRGYGIMVLRCPHCDYLIREVVPLKKTRRRSRQPIEGRLTAGSAP